MTPAILCFSLLFFFAGKWEKNTLIIPNPAAKLKNKLLESDLSNKREAIAAQIERGSPHPFARLAESSKKFRIDGIEESGEPKTRVEDLDQWLAEVERRAEAEAEAEFQTDAKKISTPKPPDKE